MQLLPITIRRGKTLYECQKKRGKSDWQIALEALARLTSNGSALSRLIEISLRGHGITKDRDFRTSPANHFRQRDPSGQVLTGRWFINVLDNGILESYESHFKTKLPALISDADRICRHEFDLLGTGLTFWGEPINWNLDPISSYRWPRKLFWEVRRLKLGDGGWDVKVPWELNRMQHLPTLGKAYRLAENERYAREISDQINHWFEDNPCPYGVNWICPMDVAIRIMNILWAYAFIQDSAVITEEFKNRLALMIFEHGQFVLYNLEYGVCEDGSVVNSNHFLTDVVGLLHLGLLCPLIKGSDRWKEMGIEGLIEEMDRQVHQDGGDFESSIPYHRLVLELFTAGALLCRLNGVTLPERFWRKLERMYEFVLYLLRPDGRAPQVGDADDGRLYILSDYGSWDRTDFRYLLSTGAALFNRSDMKTCSGEFSEESFWLLGPPGLRTFSEIRMGERPESKGFPDSGLYTMRRGRHYLLACCGAVGTNGLGNHKHNDLLSFELYSDDRAFIVDPGSYVYSRDSKWRNLFRSTSYHNTVLVDGQEQNRFNPSQIFRMSPDARVIVHAWQSTPEMDKLEVEHTGYMRLQAPVSHRRTFFFDKRTSRYEITDALKGTGEHTLAWHFHFDYGIELERVGCGEFRTRCAGPNLHIAAHSDAPLTFDLLDGFVSKRYGQKLPAVILRIRALLRSDCLCRFIISQLPLAEASL